MREIKFRAWDKNRRTMVNGGSFFDVSQTQGVDRWVFGMDVFNHPDNVELMQYTGLKDKNGKDIYEGDIVRWWDSSISKIFYNQNTASFNPITEIGNIVDMITERFEVIGNIYQNPELLDNK